MRFHTTISFKSVDNGRGGKLWFLTYDNRILGDSRPFSTAEEARSAAIDECTNGPVVNGVKRYIYRPGY